MKALIALLIGYAFAGAAQGILFLGYRSPKGRQYLISEDPRRNKEPKELYRAVALNIVVSLTFIFAVMFTLGQYIYYDRPVLWWRFLGEGLGAILIYDFGYYFMHRYLFHGWRPLMRAHSVHHASRHPRIIDSLLLHPVETVMGLSLFFISMAAVGGVHIYTFGVLFAAYATFNLLNHSGINVPRFPLKTLGRLAVVHDKHHHSMRHGNYASITPLPDLMFGTAEP